MPVATVKDGTLRFSYEDSGPLGGSYTTLVMVHGTGFHSGKWHAVLLRDDGSLTDCSLAPPSLAHMYAQGFLAR
jgi:hypothetical protein